MLSRIDGQTPWRLLREIGGLPSEEVDLCLESWLANGVVTLDARRKKKPVSQLTRARARNGAPRVCAGSHSGRRPRPIDESDLDADLDLDLDTQRRILSVEANLDRPYHELLAVAPDADARCVKRAYFKLSKEFHPDRYFRREIGSYVARLERIFKRILEAYEILSDPKLRAELERSGVAATRAEDRPSNQETPPARSAPVSDPQQGSTRPLSKLERLKLRMPFRVPESVIEERRQRAAEFRRAAALAERRESWSEAAASMRLAICFDPYNSECKAALAELQARAAEQRARELLDPSNARRDMNHHDLERALKGLEDVLLYRPHDPELNHRAAAVALELDELDRALEYARTAIEHEPEDGGLHTLLGCIHLARRDMGHARKELEAAIKLDPDDVEARKKLASMRLGSR